MLTRKQLEFVFEYMRDFNGTRAAIRAGYSELSARAIASELLKKPAVHNTIERFKLETQARHEQLRSKVIDALSKVAFASLESLAGPDGKIRPVEEWTPEMLEAIEYVKIRKQFGGRGPNRKVVAISYQVKMKDKLKALEVLAKHFGNQSR
ncbi:MAG: terminase small subunit [Candidatus Saccharimonadales bacterium]